MNKISKLLIDVLEKLLDKPLVTDEFEAFGGSRCIFYNRIKNNSGYLPDGCATVLKNLILHEVNKDKFRKNLMYDYFKYYLTNDELEYYNRNVDDFESFIIFGLSKFLKPNSTLFSKNSKHSYPKFIDKEITIESLIKKIERLYKRLEESSNEDFEIKLSLTKRIHEIICEIIFISEELNESENKKINIIESIYSKNIVPIHISLQLMNIENITRAESKVTKKDDRQDLIESCYFSIKIITKWFFVDYIKKLASISNIEKPITNFNINTNLIKETNLNCSEKIEIIRGDHIRLMEKQVEIVETAKKIFATTGSRARNEKYLVCIENALSKNKAMEYYRVLFGMPHSQYLKDHLLNCLNIIEPIEKEKGKRYLFLGYYKDTKLEPEKFICANENQALVILPSFERLMKYDSGIVFYDIKDSSRMLEYVKQLYISVTDITLESRISKLKIYKNNLRREKP